MARNYQHKQMLLGQIKELLASGMAQKEVARRLELTGYRPVHELLMRERKKEAQGIPKTRGRKPVGSAQREKEGRCRVTVPQRPRCSVRITSIF